MTEPVSILAPQEVVNDTTVRVVRLSAKTGGEVKAGQPVIELETSKSNIQVEAPADGWLQLLCKEGEDVPVGGLLGRLFASKAALEAILCPPAPATMPSEHATPEVAASTVFSDEARALLTRSGLDESLFKDRAFVKAADVRAFLEPESPHTKCPPPRPGTPSGHPSGRARFPADLCGRLAAVDADPLRPAPHRRSP